MMNDARPPFLPRTLSLKLRAVLLALLLSVSAAGQTERGSLTVRVVNAGGSLPVAGASVIVTGQTGGRRRTALTDTNGRAFIDNLEADTYTVEVSHPEIARAVVPSGVVATTVAVEDRPLFIEIQIALGVLAADVRLATPEAVRIAGPPGEVTSARSPLFSLQHNWRASPAGHAVLYL